MVLPCSLTDQSKVSFVERTHGWNKADGLALEKSFPAYFAKLGNLSTYLIELGLSHWNLCSVDFLYDYCRRLAVSVPVHLLTYFGAQET